MWKIVSECARVVKGAPPVQPSVPRRECARAWGGGTVLTEGGAQRFDGHFLTA